MQHRIYFGKHAQAVSTVPHRDGRPVRVLAATYGIFDARFGDTSNDHVVVAEGTAAAIDAVSATLTNKAGRSAQNRRTITVGSTAGMAAGRLYLLTSTAGVVELVKLAAVVSGTEVLTASELRGDFASGSLLQGAEVSAMFPAVEADDDNNLDGMPWVIVWSAPGLPPLRETIFLERGEELQLASLDDLLELDPMISVVGGDRVDPAKSLARAHRDLRTELLMAGANESDMLLGPIGRDAVTYRGAALCWMSCGDSDEASRKVDFYLERWNRLVASIKVGEPKPQVVAVSQASGEKAPSKAAIFLSHFP